MKKRHMPPFCIFSQRKGWFGSEDHVLNMTNLEKGCGYLPEKAAEYRIDGGNHAQFENYGVQKGDGEALISAAEQQKQTKDLILSALP